MRKKKLPVNKSQIIKDLVDDNVSLERSLTRLYVLVKGLNNEELSAWINCELHGYDNTTPLPDYRKTKSTLLKYSGINGGFQVTNNNFSIDVFGEELSEKLKTISFVHGIRFAEELAQEESTSRDLSELADIIYEKTDEQVMCSSIRQIIPRQFYMTICSVVKGKVLDAFLQLEQEYGNLDEYGVGISNQNAMHLQKINAELNHLILNIDPPKATNQKWYEKVAWNIVVPIITGVLGGIITAVVLMIMGLS